jgi:hypothetical protein
MPNFSLLQSSWESHALNDYLSGDDDRESLDSFLRDLDLPHAENVVFDVECHDVHCGPNFVAVFTPHVWVDGRCECGAALLSKFLDVTGWTEAYFVSEEYLADFT